MKAAKGKIESERLPHTKLYKNLNCYMYKNVIIALVPTHEKRPVSEGCRAKPEISSDQPTVLQEMKGNSKGEVSHKFQEKEVTLFYFTYTFMRFSMMSRLLTATRTTTQRLNNPAWLCPIYSNSNIL